MSDHADKTKESENQSAPNANLQKKSSGGFSFELADNRSESIAQRKLQEMANHSQQATQLAAMAGNATISGDSPIQMVKPGDKAAAQALTVGTVSKVKRVGHRGRGKHRGTELKQQLIAAGEDAAALDGLTFKEYDVNEYDGVERDAERIVEASDGRIFYTADHYAVDSFQELS